MKNLIKIILVVSFLMAGLGSSRAAHSVQAFSGTANNGVRDLRCHNNEMTISSNSENTRKVDKTWIEDEILQQEIGDFWNEIKSSKVRGIGAFIDDENHRLVILADSESSNLGVAKGFAEKAFIHVRWRAEIRCREIAELNRIKDSLLPTLEKFTKIESGVTADVDESNGSVVIGIASGSESTLLDLAPQIRHLPIEIMLSDSGGASFFVRCGDAPFCIPEEQHRLG